ncbi:MAG TPA: hypothetical protein VNJ08_16105 [Bacteriovoracaceae bacterium]|nr:hypothetical protein [Bacteriovoracaceae bacterium]
MVQIILSFFLLMTMPAEAQFLGFGGKNGEFKSRIPALLEKLKAMDMKADSLYEESFNLGVKNIENGMEEEKLFCSGEAVDAEGKSLPPDKKQLCMRELKKHYLDAMSMVFDLKKKYLGLIHTRQVERMGEIHSKLKSNIEKNF